MTSVTVVSEHPKQFHGPEKLPDSTQVRHRNDLNAGVTVLIYDLPLFGSAPFFGKKGRKGLNVLKPHLRVAIQTLLATEQASDKSSE